MLEFERQPSSDPKRKRIVKYWLITIKFPNLNNMSFRLRSTGEVADVTGIPLQTLKKMIYDKDNYKTKRYKEFMQYVECKLIF